MARSFTARPNLAATALASEQEARDQGPEHGTEGLSNSDLHTLTYMCTYVCMYIYMCIYICIIYIYGFGISRLNLHRKCLVRVLSAQAGRIPRVPIALGVAVAAY